LSAGLLGGCPEPTVDQNDPDPSTSDGAPDNAGGAAQEAPGDTVDPNAGETPDGDPNGSGSEPSGGEQPGQTPGGETPAGGGGDPGDPGDPPADPLAITDTWTGTLSCQVTQSLGGTTGATTTKTRQLSITFDQDGLPDGLLIPGFVDAPDQTATVLHVGQSQTLNSMTSQFQITHVVTVREARYTAAGARVVLDIRYEADGGTLQQEGFAVQTIDVAVSGDSLNYSSTISYDVSITAPVTLETGEVTICEGVLQRQP
jgi:hypothetical protein